MYISNQPMRFLQTPRTRLALRYSQHSPLVVVYTRPRYPRLKPDADANDSQALTDASLWAGLVITVPWPIKGGPPIATKGASKAAGNGTKSVRLIIYPDCRLYLYARQSELPPHAQTCLLAYRNHLRISSE